MSPLQTQQFNHLSIVRTKSHNLFKGNILELISSDPSSKERKAWFRTVPFKPLYVSSSTKSLVYKSLEKHLNSCQTWYSQAAIWTCKYMSFVSCNYWIFTLNVGLKNSKEKNYFLSLLEND